MYSSLSILGPVHDSHKDISTVCIDLISAVRTISAGASQMLARKTGRARAREVDIGATDTNKPGTEIRSSTFDIFNTQSGQIIKLPNTDCWRT